MKRVTTLVVALVLLFVPTSVDADFAAIEKHLVVVKDEIENAEQAPGFVISNQGHIVTYADKLRDRQKYLISTAQGQFDAAKIKADDQTGLWILQLSDSSHGLTGLPFAKTVLRAAAPLYAVTFNPSGSNRFTSTHGTVTQIENAEQGQMILHNALFSLASAGTPLLNRCYQAVGVNVLQEQGFLRRRAVDPIQAKIAQSVTADSLDRLLASLSLSRLVADTECLSLEEEKEEQGALAKAALEEKEAALQREKAALEEKEAALQREKVASEEKEEQGALAKAALEEKEAALQREKAALEEKEAALQREKAALRQKEAERLKKEGAEREARALQQRQQQILLYGSIIGGVVLLGVMLLIRRKQKRLRATEQEKQNIAGALDQAQAELSQATEQDRLRSSAPDVFLEGETPPIALKIPGTSLVEQAGAVVGRSPAASTFVINHEQVSRQHFRLSLVAQQVIIEDLGSTNGTSLDGVAVEAGKPTPVRDGNRLGLGDLELTLHLDG